MTSDNSLFTGDPAPYDALLLVSFGGPEGPADVLPFLENVTRGRGIPPERLHEVGQHYDIFGGVSPLNGQNRELLAALRSDLAASGLDLPLYWGNRNWHPYLPDTLAEMARDGVRRAAAFFTSAYPSYSGCRQYRENLADAAAPLGAAAPRLDKLRHYFNMPGFHVPTVRNTLAALQSLPADLRAGAHLAFTTHSIPSSTAATSGPHGDGYVDTHREAARLVAEGVAAETGTTLPWRLVFQSRSGPPEIPWLVPDVNDALAELQTQGASAVVLVPVGFVSDHVEVRYDLDIEAARTAAGLGLTVARAATVGTAPEFVAMIRELLLERAALERGEAPVRRTVGGSPPSHDACPARCCPNPRGDRSALAGAEPGR